MNAAYFSSSPELLSPETKHYLVLFVFSNTKRIYFDFRINYLYSEV